MYEKGCLEGINKEFFIVIGNVNFEWIWFIICLLFIYYMIINVKIVVFLIVF